MERLVTFRRKVYFLVYPGLDEGNGQWLEVIGVLFTYLYEVCCIVRQLLNTVVIVVMNFIICLLLFSHRVSEEEPCPHCTAVISKPKVEHALACHVVKS